MILLLYLAVFLVALYIRRRVLLGNHLRPQVSDGGREYLEHIAYKHAKNGEKTSATPSLGLWMDARAHFVIGRERFYHRVLKAVGLAAELQTGDGAFDSAFFLVSSDPEQLASLAESERFRNHVRRLFDIHGVKSLRAFGDRIWVNVKSVRAHEVTQEFKNRRLSLLNDIAGDIEVLGGTHSESSGIFSKPHIAVGFMILHAALLATGILGALPPLVESEETLQFGKIIGIGIAFTVTLLGFWVFAIFVLLGRSAWTAIVLADFVLVGAFGALLSSVFLAREINIRLDSSPPQAHVQAVLDRECSIVCRKRGGRRRSSRTATYELTDAQCRPEMRESTLALHERTQLYCNYSARFSYRLSIEPLTEKQEEPFRFFTGASVYDGTRTQKSVVVPVHEGRLGVQWVDIDRIAPAGNGG